MQSGLGVSAGWLGTKKQNVVPLTVVRVFVPKVGSPRLTKRNSVRAEEEAGSESGIGEVTSPSWGEIGDECWVEVGE